MRFRPFSLLACVLWSMWNASGAGAFENDTHELINLAAARLASVNQITAFDQFLKDSVGLVRGLSTPFKDANGTTSTALDWLALGGTAEDKPLCRPARHFHDPLQPWSSAGLSTLNPIIGVKCGFSFPSSVLWAQNRSQNVGQKRSWFEARPAYVDALTGTSQPNRDQAWANTFQTLGQLMHLVADASVPEHVRNDSHLLETVVRQVLPAGYGSYEWWVEDNLGFVPLSGKPPFDRTILRQSTNSVEAPIPIARLFDTRIYTGLNSGPGVTLTSAIGIAEFANANFFSEDTGNRGLSGRNYPFPALDLLAESQLQAPFGTNIRRYYKKGADGGLAVNPVLAECVFDDAARAAGLAVPSTYNCVDQNVWQATAQEMVPRAVDYAAGLIEYFFRGRLEIAAPGRFAYGLAAYQPGNAGKFTKLRFKVRNATPGEDTGPGQLIAVVQYRTPITNESLIDNPTAAISAQLSFAVSQPLSVTLTSSFQEFLFDFSQSPPYGIPTNAADLFLTAVYTGRLGLEDGAVMVGGKDLFEPDPVDVGNASDWECFQSTLHHVADLTTYPPYLPPGQTQRDVSNPQDGIQDLFGPAMAFNEFVKTFDLAQPVPTAAEMQGSFNARWGQTAPTEYARLMVLQDQPWYGGAALTLQTQDVPSGLVRPGVLQAGALGGVFNDVVVGQFGELRRRILLSSVYRSVPIYHALLLVTDPTIACLPQTGALDPPLSRIDSTLAAE